MIRRRATTTPEHRRDDGGRHLLASATGFAIGFSLIMAIGAQNAFVLRQGLIGAHVFWICLLCAMSDALLISAGVLLAGSVSAQAGWAMQWITLAGAAFLIIYGSIAAMRAFSPGRLVGLERSPQALASAALTCLALTWLIPVLGDPDFRRGFPNGCRHDSSWRTGEVLHGGSDWAEERLHGG